MRRTVKTTLMIVCALLVAVPAQATIHDFDLRYDVTGGTAFTGPVSFSGMVSIDDTDPAFVPGGNVPWSSYMASFPAVGDWELGVDNSLAGLVLQLGADLATFTDVDGMGGIVFDDVAPLGTFENIVHFGTLFQINMDGGNVVLYSGVLTIRPKNPLAIPTLSEQALVALGGLLALAAIAVLRRRVG